MYTGDRDTEVIFLKKLWRGEMVVCPKCKNGSLIHLHKKAKKSNNDWKCPQCGEIYRTITMLQELPND